MESYQVAAALQRHRHPDTYRKEWIFLRELCTGTGGGGGQNYIDAFAMNCWPSTGYVRTAYEIKVSRGDFLREIKNPTKRLLAMNYSHYFFFAAPEGLLRADEMPEDCGLVEVSSTGVRVARRAAKRSGAATSDWGFVASALRLAQTVALGTERVV